MLKTTDAFSSFPVNDIEAARAFYGGKLGLEVRDAFMDFVEVVVSPGQRVNIYPKPDHEPAAFTVLNFVVDDIDEAVDDLVAAGVKMEQYDMPEMKQDAKGIAHVGDGRAIAWFKDPAGNILSVVKTA